MFKKIITKLSNLHYVLSDIRDQNREIQDQLRSINSNYVSGSAEVKKRLSTIDGNVSSIRGKLVYGPYPFTPLDPGLEINNPKQYSKEESPASKYWCKDYEGFHKSEEEEEYTYQKKKEKELGRLLYELDSLANRTGRSNFIIEFSSSSLKYRVKFTEVGKVTHWKFKMEDAVSDGIEFIVCNRQQIENVSLPIKKFTI